MTSSPDEYKVGYRKPPQEHRFRPGQSGNPKGRPKTRKTPQIDLDELLGDPVRANTNRGSVLMDPFEAQIRKQLEMAMKGNVPSIEYLLNLFIQHEAVVPPEGVRNWGVLVVPTRQPGKEPANSSGGSEVLQERSG